MIVVVYLLLPCQPVPRGHGVTEGDLPLAHGHVVGGQQVAENMLRLPVRPLVPAFVVHLLLLSPLMTN